MGNTFCHNTLYLLEKLQLKCKNKEKSPKFTTKGQTKPVYVDSVYDGDTITIVMMNGMKSYKYKVRMLGYDSPEMKPPKDDPNREEIKKNALISKQVLENLILHKYVTMYFNGEDKYGRLLGTIFIYHIENKSCKKNIEKILCNLCKKKINVNDWMVENGYGYHYEGGTKIKSYGSETSKV
jgi:endonuclease YncB( thermonuclease family)